MRVTEKVVLYITSSSNLKLQSFLGSSYYDMRPYDDTLHRRHFYWLTLQDQPAKQWTHIEDSGGAGPAYSFEFFWQPIIDCHILAAAQGAMLGTLHEKMLTSDNS